MDNRLLRAGKNTYTHDDNGFRSIWSNGGTYCLYEYAPDYRLLKMEVEDENRVFTFRHDEEGQRAAKYLNGRLAEAYQWLDFIRLGAFHDGRMGYEFGYAEGERLPSAMRREDGAVFTLHYDQVGSLRVVADAHGNVIKGVLYDPFGGIIEDTNPGLRVPIGFAGGLHDRDLGFVRFGWRDYDVNTGRWTAPDPIGDNGGDPDWYGYCLDDPVNGVDPLGLFRFGKRPLDFLPDGAHWIGTDGSVADQRNYELKHEHGFFEDGTGNNVSCVPSSGVIPS
jgi:RHS repeat-associated protein